jgi:hypothetical protein
MIIYQAAVKTSDTFAMFTKFRMETGISKYWLLVRLYKLT